MKKSIYSICIITSGCLWGLMGYFRRRLGDMGLDSFGVVMVRCLGAALMFALVIAVKNPRRFIVKPKDMWCFFGLGICSLLFFSSCYFQAMTVMSLSAAAILLYTAPVFVIIMSAIIFKEKMTRIKILAMIMAFAGCCLVSGIIGDDTRITAIGLLYGLGAGFGYALFSIFSKLALDREYSSLTINFYSCALAFLGAGIIWGFKAPMSVMAQSLPNCIFCIFAGMITCFFPYLLYTYGLTGVEAGKASIMASIEPVVATILGFAIYGERPGISAVFGIILVLSAIVLLNINIPDNSGNNEKTTN